MHWLSSGRWAVALALMVLAAGSHELLAQAGGPERVRFDTFDGVTLRGSFYPSSKGSKAPCVILLHQFGGDSTQEGWGTLAKALQEKGFAVLAFDFRGHGDSTAVDPKRFWSIAQNKMGKGFNPAKPRSDITHKDFNTFFHYMTLVNDIAAAKRYLDTRNDSQECNSANLILIGAESGATLGAVWMATEWESRPVNPFKPPPAKQSLGGQDISCAIWLSISPNLGTFKAPLDTCLRVQQVKEKNPMYFLYGAQDPKAKSQVQHLYNDVLRIKADKKVSKLTGTLGIEGTKLKGRDLLAKTLDTQTRILEYIEKVLSDAGTNPYQRRDVSKTELEPVPIGRFLK